MRLIAAAVAVTTIGVLTAGCGSSSDAATTTAWPTASWASSRCSTSAGATQMPLALIRSPVRPRQVNNPSALRTYVSPVRSHSPWKTCREAAYRDQ